MRVLEFERVLLDGAAEIRHLARLVAGAAREDRLVLVLPALWGVPEELLQASRIAEAGGDEYGPVVHAIRDRHLSVVQELFPPRDRARVITPLQITLNDLEDVLHGVQLVRECTSRTRDLILSFGVTMGCVLLGACLTAEGLDAVLVDGRELIRVRPEGRRLRVDRDESCACIRRRLAGESAVPVISGGIGALPEGGTAALGWEDTTAFLIGSALGADLIEIWTDCDGVMSADPGHVPEAFVVAELDYQEAMEMSYFGARILHPQAMLPAVEGAIPIRLRNGRRPEAPGTLISGRASPSLSAIRGIASIDQVALVNIEGGGMVGIPGIAARVFGSLARAQVNIMMISQASSEHSICLVFRESEAERVRAALEEEFRPEIETGAIQRFDLRRELVIVAVIGENMRGTPGISGRLFSALGDAGVNVLAIAQGSSERNISLVVAGGDEGAALRSIHGVFLAGGGAV